MDQSGFDDFKSETSDYVQTNFKLLKSQMKSLTKDLQGQLDKVQTDLFAQLNIEFGKQLEEHQTDTSREL